MLPLYSKYRFSLFHIFFYFFIFELCIGGSGGAFLKSGAITLRKIDFVIALGVAVFIYCFKNRLPKNVAVITLAFLSFTFFGALIGFLNYGNDSKVYDDFFMLSFFFLLPFYSLFITNLDSVKKIILIVKISAVIMALIYLGVLLAIVLNVIPFLTVYNYISGNDDLLSRGSLGFWYKGFVYMCAGIYFWWPEKRFWIKWFIIILLLTAIFFTFTRGFFLAIFLTAILFNLFFRNFFKGLAIIIACVFIIAYFNQFYISISFDRDESDRIRTTQIQQVMDRVNPVSFFIGHGLGEGVPIRDTHMEINYLEVFHKQGIIGVLFWALLLTYIIISYINIRKTNPQNEMYARAFLLSTLFIYFESFTNPFLTNSIGLNLVMLTIVCFNVLKNNNDESVSYNGYL